MMMKRALVVASLAAFVGCGDDSVGGSGDAGGSDSTGAGSMTAAMMMTDGGSSSGSQGGTVGADSGTTAEATTAQTSEGSSSGAGSESDADSGTDTGSSSDTAGDSTTAAETGSTEGEGSTTASVGPLEIGDDCKADNQCMTGVCWDFSDYDPFCFGAVCSIECQNNGDCVQAFTEAGSPNAMGATCGGDGRCEGLGSGFGAFACAGPG